MDGSATEVVVALVSDHIGENQPFTPRQTGILGGKRAIGPAFLDGGNVVIIDTNPTSKGGILEDFRLALADLDGPDGAEGCELTLEGHETVDTHGKVHSGEARGEGGEGGGGGCVVHAY